jgi:hypothetical protein
MGSTEALHQSEIWRSTPAVRGGSTEESRRAGHQQPGRSALEGRDPSRRQGCTEEPDGEPGAAADRGVERTNDVA